MYSVKKGIIMITQYSLIDVLEDDILEVGRNLLETLLKDRTTKYNILWATEDYKYLGREFFAREQIKIHSITGQYAKIIQPRITKEKSNQQKRTREKAEVFTPSIVCNTQNNLVDEIWFGRKEVFNVPTDEGWKTNKDKISFPDGKKWEKYVDAKRLEIACGEAPYLVSRYDTVSGKKIDVKRRIGLLDRKLRVINENVNEEADWFKWVVRAFQSVYGFEYQGDNLLLARENLLFTFIDNVKFKFHKKPTLVEQLTIAKIISWNLWQMDGLTYTVPYANLETIYNGDNLFGEEMGEKENKSINQLCHITDWRSKVNVSYKSLLRGKQKDDK
jgi:hypothetical protein